MTRDVKDDFDKLKSLGNIRGNGEAEAQLLAALVIMEGLNEVSLSLMRVSEAIKDKRIPG